MSTETPLYIEEPSQSMYMYEQVHEAFETYQQRTSAGQIAYIPSDVNEGGYQVTNDGVRLGALRSFSISLTIGEEPGFVINGLTTFEDNAYGPYQFDAILYQDRIEVYKLDGLDPETFHYGPIQIRSLIKNLIDGCLQTYITIMQGYHLRA